MSSLTDTTTVDNASVATVASLTEYETVLCIQHEDMLRDDNPDMDDDAIDDKMMAFKADLIAARGVSDDAETDKAEGTPEAEPDNTLSGATEAEQRKIDDYAASQERVVELAASTLDPKDMLRKYVGLGMEVHKLAKRRKDSLKPGAWNGKDDLAKVCSDLETLVKMRVAVKSVQMNVYLRVYVWVTAVKLLVPDVVKLSYHQVVNKFLPTLAFDADALTGTVREGWVGWVTATVQRQLGDDPMTMAELDQAIADRKAEIKVETERRKGDGGDPEKEIARVQKAAEAKARAERTASKDKVRDAIDKAVTAEHADADDLVDIVEKVLRDHKIAMPVSGFNPATATKNDCLMLAKGLAANGKLAEMRVLRDTLDAMIKMAENAFAASKAG